jgi:hypothetical protein
MKHRQEVYRLLFPADKKASEAIDPRRDPLDHPTAGAAAACSFLRLLFAARLDMRSIATPLGAAADRLCVEALIATEMLPFARSGSRAANRNAIQRGVEELLIMHIGPSDGYAQRDAAPVGQHRPLHPQFAAVCRVFPGFFPRPEGPWLSTRPGFATSIGCHAVDRSVAAGTSTACETGDAGRTPESTGARNCPNRTPQAPLSIGNLYAICKRCRSSPSAAQAAGDLPDATCGTSAKRVPYAATSRQGFSNLDSFAPSPQHRPP